MTPNTIFENHVFISYAHIDNARFTESEKGWIDRLQEALDCRVPQLMGEPVKIWRDQSQQHVVAERGEQVRSFPIQRRHQAESRGKRRVSHSMLWRYE